MRWGKTKTAIDFANAMHDLEGVKRVLVICPIAALGVWPDEIDLHTPEGYDLEWMIVNFESVYDRVYGKNRTWSQTRSRELHDFDADLFIVDEVHNLGNPNAVSSRFAYDLSRQARFRLLMTGTAFHRKPFYVFGQAKLYDPAVFGTSFSAFKQMVAVMGGYGGYEVIRYQNLDWMMDKLRPWMWIEDYVPPGDPMVNVLRYNLTGTNLERYVAMERDSIITFDDGETVTSPIVLSRHLRCQMIAGGWVKLESGKYRRVGKDAYRVALSRFHEYADEGIEKVVVGCRFIPEIRDVADAAVRAGYRPILMHGAVNKHLRPHRIKDFNRTDDRAMFIAQMATAKEAIDLSSADTMMLYSLSESFVTHDQFTRRIEKYQDDRQLQYDYLVATGTRAEVTYEALKVKQDVATFMPRNPRLVEEITAKLSKETRDENRTDRRRHHAAGRR